MAVGNRYNNNGDNNNNKKGFFIQEHYSLYGMSNVNSPLDPSKLSFSYWAGKLKISVNPLKKSSDNSIAFDYQNNISVFVTHTKAYILSSMIKEWIKDHNYATNMSIDTGSNGMITLSDGKEYGMDKPCISIKNIDEKGEKTAEFIYVIKSNYHYGIKNYNDKTKEFEKVYFDDLEIIELLRVLDNYVSAATGAGAAFVAEELKYDISRLNTKSNLICENLGIINPEEKGNYSKKANNSSFFNNSSKSNKEEVEFDSSMNKPSRTSSINDLDDGLD